MIMTGIAMVQETLDTQETQETLEALTATRLKRIQFKIIIIENSLVLRILKKLILVRVVMM